MVKPKEWLEIGDKVRISSKTHIGATPYQGKRGVITEIISESPQGYNVRLEGQAIRLFFLDWEVLKEE